MKAVIFKEAKEDDRSIKKRNNGKKDLFRRQIDSFDAGQCGSIGKYHLSMNC